jgi:hypothetical protein
MAKKPAKRFWVGSPDGFGMPDDDLIEGCLSPDEDGNVYLKKPAEPTPRRMERGNSKDRAKKPRKP